jgi:hypothetical protein
MPATKLEDLLNARGSGNLDQLIRRAADMNSLVGVLRDSLAPALADHLIAANVRGDGELVLICSSSAWAARCRFESDALLARARTAGFEATSLHVTVTQQV